MWFFTFERSVNRFQNWIYGAWHNGVILRIWTPNCLTHISRKQSKPLECNKVNQIKREIKLCTCMFKACITPHCSCGPFLPGPAVPPGKPSQISRQLFLQNGGHWEHVERENGVLGMVEGPLLLSWFFSFEYLKAFLTRSPGAWVCIQEKGIHNTCLFTIHIIYSTVEHTYISILRTSFV
jgi:hypothetical protein